ncbi:MAG: hypothetical protein GC180_03995 [Bacteroidetes bacterium]|nr:hypothetical protein [Bacteroidota bacterium]
MKKLGIMIALAGIVSIGLSSCGGDTTTTTKPTPKFDFITGAGYTATNGSVSAGTVIKIGIDASGSENLESVGVRSQVGTGQQTTFALAKSTGGDTLISDLKTKNFSITFDYQVGSLPSTEKITVIVKMSNGTQTQKTLLMTVTAATKNVVDAPGRQMGAQSNSTYGSYYSFDVNNAVLQADANSNPAGVDWVYYFGSSNSATFAAPDDATLNSSNVMGNTSLPNWSTKNATRFKKLSGFDYAGLATSDQLQAEIAKGAPTLSAITNMQVGDIYLFITASAKEYGAVKITGINTGAAGDISFDMKFISEQ